MDHLEAIHPVHVDIRKHQIHDRFLGLLQQIHGLGALGERMDLHPMLGQGIADHVEHRDIVVDDQHVR